MGRPIKNIEQIRSLLGRMDRLIDDARSKREGGPAAQPTSPPTPPPMNAPTLSNGNSAAPLGAPRIGPAPTPRPQSPSGFSTPLHANGSNGRPASPGTPAQPQRLKAKPKRPGSDPLQDFQQRQAS
ncbi:MAG: hypothetical protein U0572_07530 [Phycisphaerales bacterium]